MNKIRFAANLETNYVFHMLSAAGCGYDNSYGRHYASRYPYDDLAVLKDHGELITVCGGQHCGALYDIFVCRPATAKCSAKAYYTALLQKARDHGLPQELNAHSETIRALAAVMIRHYDDFVENIWQVEQSKILEYIPTIQKLFEGSDFTERAEAAVGHRLPTDHFTATLVTSVENGPEAIDISGEQDVFGIERSPVDALYFIGHEFIIYLLFDLLKEEKDARSLDTWNITEGLAEYYLKQVLGDTRFFQSQREYVRFFERINAHHTYGAASLYRKAAAAFMRSEDPERRIDL